MGGSITATWTGSYTRDPIVYAAGYPPLAPLAISVDNTAGQWLFCLVSWRQDAGTAGTLQYPSTVTVCDDAHNFWIPVTSGQPQTGIVRCAAWMAPAARSAEYVFICPTGFQSAMTAMVAEVTADCPWYQVAAQASAYTNQGTSITLSQDPAAGYFSLGMLAWDDNAATVSVTATGWTATTSADTSNGADHTGDLTQNAYYLTSSGSTQTISASSGTTMDWAQVIICVQGVTNTLAFPYAIPLENWPVLITEIGAGAVLNANPLMLSGATDWSGQNATVAAVTWPAWNPWPYYQTLITESLQVTPSGSETFGDAQSGAQTVSPVVRYTALAWMYTPSGYSGGTFSVFINWFDDTSTYISTSGGPNTAVPAGAWTLLTLSAPVFPPANAVTATVGASVGAASGDVPSSEIYYVGYCGFGPADAYEGTPADEIAWTDFSSRNYTESAIAISRGIQYEQQSLEAGTMTVTLANNDFELMYGNTESSFWPTIGDTDVPIRLRAVWPGSITPYYVLFSGFTDDIAFSWNDELRYSYASVQASDVWSRLTQQMLGAAEQDVLEDSPVGFWTCNLSGANLASGATGTVSTWTSAFGADGATATFASTAISLAGDPGVSCWQSTGTTAGDLSFTGVALGYFPPAGTSLPPVSGGVTVDFWMSPQSVSADQPASDNLTVCACWSGSGALAWELNIANSGGASGSNVFITVFDKSTGAATSTQIGTATFLGTDSAPAAAYFAITFTQTSLTAVFNPGGTVTGNETVTCNLGPVISGFSWGGRGGPFGTYPLSGSPGFMNLAVYGIGLYDYLVPPTRLASHYATAFSAYPLEIDTARLARVAGWAGFTPVLAMRCQDLSPSSELVTASVRDLDGVTAATDTSGQVVSSYFTNIAQSTLAFLLADGPGNLVYRRRLESDNRAPGQWALGENAAVPLNSNTLNQEPSVAGWVAENSATLVSSSQTITPLFYPWCAEFTGNGSTANPQFSYGSIITSGVTVTPGDWYDFSAWLYSPQGFGNGSSTGVYVSVQFVNSGLSTIATFSSGVTAAPAGGLLFLTSGTVQAPAAAAFAWLIIGATGTPASTVHFYAADAVFAQVSPVLAGGAGATAPEAPYPDPGKLLSSDRAQLYNQAILTQYGPNTQSTFTGTFISFTPSSGVVVTIGNAPSIALRGQVPYTATIYLDNTAQAVPYYFGQPSIEDFGNWIVQTLGSPLFRPLTVKITPAATPQALLTGLQAEVGDTFTFRRRHLLNPEVQILTYCSKLSHKIKIDEEGSGQWETTYELSPFPQGSILAAGDVVHGCGTGGNLIGF